MKLPDCFSGYGHDWVEVSTIGEATVEHKRTWLCARCETLVTVNESERIRRGQQSGFQKPPVRVVVPNPKVNRCPRKIVQHTGGCYCMTYICCGRLSPDPHTDDCGGTVTVYEREDGTIPGDETLRETIR